MPTQVSFYIHESLISTESAFACTAFESVKDMAERPAITLPEEAPQIFRVYQQWLYSGLICTRSDHARSTTDDEYETLVKAYVLGENLKAGKFRDALIDCIITKLRTENSFDVTLVHVIWAGELQRESAKNQGSGMLLKSGRYADRLAQVRPRAHLFAACG